MIQRFYKGIQILADSQIPFWSGAHIELLNRLNLPGKYARSTIKLKIDCEGAEWEILEATPIPLLKKIKNIVMETHNVYDENALIKRLKKAGFKIVMLHSFKGKGAGFLKATRSTQVKKMKRKR